MKKQIILSYDYELFFGNRSGTVLKTIIEPTNRLMDTMEHQGFQGNFFVDYLMFFALEQQSDAIAQNDLKMLKQQICDMVRRSHRIELHLHPHWLDAKYNNDGTWDFSDFSHYSLSSLEEKDITSLFQEGTQYLHNIVQSVDPNYKICAFRAGGWAIQPFDKLKAAFIEAGILIDSSTSLGAFSIREGSSYDFRHMSVKSLYRFQDDVCVETQDGQFLEVPITSFHRNLFLVLVDRICSKFGYFRSNADGTHTRNEKKGQISNQPSLREKLNKKYRLMFSLSMLSPLTVLLTLLFHHKQDLYCYIDHPKDLSRATLANIWLLGHFCQSKSYVELI